MLLKYVVRRVHDGLGLLEYNGKRYPSQRLHLCLGLRTSDPTATLLRRTPPRVQRVSARRPWPVPRLRDAGATVAPGSVGTAAAGACAGGDICDPYSPATTCSCPTALLRAPLRLHGLRPGASVMHEVAAEPPDHGTGSTLQVFRLVACQRSSHSRHRRGGEGARCANRFDPGSNRLLARCGPGISCNFTHGLPRDHDRVRVKACHTTFCLWQHRILSARPYRYPPERASRSRRGLQQRSQRLLPTVGPAENEAISGGTNRLEGRWGPTDSIGRADRHSEGRALYPGRAQGWGGGSRACGRVWRSAGAP